MIIFGRQPQSSRIGPKKPQPPSVPKSFFEEKKQWRKNTVKRRFRQGSRLIPGTRGGYYHLHEIDKMLDERFRWDTHRGFISREGAIRELKKLRMEEHRASTSEKKRELRRQRSFLEQGFELKGAY